MSLHKHECRGHNMRDLTLYKLLGEDVSYIIGDISEQYNPYRSDVFPDKLKNRTRRNRQPRSSPTCTRMVTCLSIPRRLIRLRCARLPGCSPSGIPSISRSHGPMRSNRWGMQCRHCWHRPLGRRSERLYSINCPMSLNGPSDTDFPG
jgi:hypothetical protein